MSRMETLSETPGTLRRKPAPGRGESVATHSEAGNDPEAITAGIACLYCGATFTAARPWQRFCKPRHKWLHWAETHPRVELVETTKGGRKGWTVSLFLPGR